MKKIILSIGCLVSAVLTYAQSPSFQWAKSFGGPTYDEAYSITADASGNVYTTGFFHGTVDFDPGADTVNLNSGSNNYTFISKLNTSGNFVWAKNIGGLGTSISVDGSGNVYTTGYFSGTADFNPGAGITNLTSAGSIDIFISKLDATGNFVWAKQIGGSLMDRGSCIIVDASGNVYTTGYFSGTADFDPGAGTFNLTASGGAFIPSDIFISKLDAAGNFVWAKNMGDIGNSIALDPSGNVYCTGRFSGTADFDPNAGIYNLTAAGDYDIVISKLNASGIFLWAKKIGGTLFDEGYSIATDQSGNVYTSGGFQGTVDFDPGPEIFNLNGGSGFISKLDSSGNFVWAKNVGGAITLDASGNVYTTGNFFGTVDFDPGTAIVNLTAAGDNDIFISKLDASGNFVWAKNIGGPLSDIGNSIKIDVSGNIYTTGYFAGTADFDPDGGTFNLTSAGDNDFFIHKMSQCIAPAPPSNTTLSTNLSICNGNSTTLSASGIGSLSWYSSPTGDTYLKGGSSFLTPVLATSTTYYAQDSTCTVSAIRTPVLVKVNPLPIVTANASATKVCAGTALILSGGGASSYVWTGGVFNAAEFIPVATTTYTVTGTDANNCSNTSTITITVNPLPDASTNLSGLTISANQTGAVYQWLDCNNGNSPIAGATSQSFTATTTGDYSVIVLMNACSDTSTCVNINITGINEMVKNKNQLSVFPNPSTKGLTIQSTSEGAYSITNETGQTIQVFELNNSNKYSVSIENLSNGIYFIVGFNNNQMTRQKVVVVK